MDKHDEMCLCDTCFTDLTGITTKPKSIIKTFKPITVTSIKEIIYYAMYNPKQVIVLASINKSTTN